MTNFWHAHRSFTNHPDEARNDAGFLFRNSMLQPECIGQVRMVNGLILNFRKIWNENNSNIVQY